MSTKKPTLDRPLQGEGEPVFPTVLDEESEHIARLRKIVSRSNRKLDASLKRLDGLAKRQRKKKT